MSSDIKITIGEPLTCPTCGKGELVLTGEQYTKAETKWDPDKGERVKTGYQTMVYPGMLRIRGYKVSDEQGDWSECLECDKWFCTP